MTMAETLFLNAGSRYKDTLVHEGSKGFEFGVYQPPPEFFDRKDAMRHHRVQSQDVGQLDAIAVRYYGEGMESMWWTIAQANHMIDPAREMSVGQVIVIPPVDLVMTFVSRAPDEQA